MCAREAAGFLGSLGPFFFFFFFWGGGGGVFFFFFFGGGGGVFGFVFGFFGVLWGFCRWLVFKLLEIFVFLDFWCLGFVWGTGA